MCIRRVSGCQPVANPPLHENWPSKAPGCCSNIRKELLGIEIHRIPFLAITSVGIQSAERGIGWDLGCREIGPISAGIRVYLPVKLHIPYGVGDVEQPIKNAERNTAPIIIQERGSIWRH